MTTLLFKRERESRATVTYLEALNSGDNSATPILGQIHVSKEWARDEETLVLKLRKASEIGKEKSCEKTS